MSEHLVTEISPDIVAEQFEDADQQREAATLGMWTFLATEILFFGTLFVTYTIYRHQYPRDFLAGSLDLKWYLGGINTAVLLLSSFFMAMAVQAGMKGSNRGIIRYLVLTIAAGTLFLGIKGAEYYIEYREHLIPGLNFSRTEPDPRETGALVRTLSGFEHRFNEQIGALPPPTERTKGEELFMTYYFIMTAIHATHMLIGIAIMFVLIIMAKRGLFSAKYHNPIEMFGLYWHFVDIVWVFLYPTLYLLRLP